MRQGGVYQKNRFSYEVLPSLERADGKYNLLVNHGVGQWPKAGAAST